MKYLFLIIIFVKFQFIFGMEKGEGSKDPIKMEVGESSKFGFIRGYLDQDQLNLSGNLDNEEFTQLQLKEHEKINKLFEEQNKLCQGLEKNLEKQSQLKNDIEIIKNYHSEYVQYIHNNFQKIQQEQKFNDGDDLMKK
ncbi:unnamed protein product [Meloidogyne enterolobii]|uniref:Uncharacterized protein n=1 Tax=Meloidogyne enterolobii TaxID=390850 RepID=A0ACB0ZYL0_MELEN